MALHVEMLRSRGRQVFGVNSKRECVLGLEKQQLDKSGGADDRKVML